MKFADRFKTLFRLGSSNDQLFDDLADLLVEGDIGATLSFSIVEELRLACRAEGSLQPQEIRSRLKSILMNFGRETDVAPLSGALNVFLVLGVNGVGKTTTCAKLANYYKKKGARVLLAAADTFRAAATEQLRIHGERLGIRVVSQGHGADPGAVVWDAIDAARADHSNLVLADTAGRMHTRTDLMRELSKIDKVVATRAEGATYRRLLVLDSTTGQNGLRQAETFAAAVKLDGIVLSKQDSSAKGGLAITVAKELGIPTAFLGTGEGYDDIEPFSLGTFLDGFLGL